jgi:hypothetical protein
LKDKKRHPSDEPSSLNVALYVLLSVSKTNQKNTLARHTFSTTDVAINRDLSTA